MEGIAQETIEIRSFEIKHPKFSGLFCGIFENMLVVNGKIERLIISDDAELKTTALRSVKKIGGENFGIFF